MDIALGQRRLHRQCRFTYEGAPVCIDWSQFIAVTSARVDYDDLGLPSRVPIAGGGSQLVWGPTFLNDSPCQGLPFKTAKIVEGQLWGIATYSSSSGVANDARDYFGEFRPVSQWSGIAQ